MSELEILLVGVAFMAGLIVFPILYVKVEEFRNRK